MTTTFVTITGQWDAATSASTTNYSNGNFQFVAAGTLMSSSGVALVYPYIDGQLDSLGALSVPAGGAGSIGGGTPNSGVSLLASDNFAAGELVYNIKIQVQGIPPINAFDIPVNFALGASQGIFLVLQAAGWVADTF